MSAMDTPAAKSTRILKALCLPLAWSLVLLALTDTFAEPDLWGYLNFGKLFWREPGFPWKDAFSYTPTNEVWVFHEWLTGALLFRINEVLGAPGLQGLRYALAILAAWLIYATAKRRGAPGLGAAASILFAGAFFSWTFPAFRALVFTYTFFALFLFVMERARLAENHAGLWVLPVVMLFWANLHGGFPAGLGVVFLYAMGRLLSGQRSGPYWKVLVACALVTLVNPYGPALWGAVLGHVSEPQQGVREWVSAPGAMILFGPSYDLAIFFSALGLGACLLLAGGMRDRTALPVLLGAGLAGFVHHRHMPFFMISLAVFAPPMAMAALQKQQLAGKCVKQCAIMGLAGAFALGMMYFNVQFFLQKTPMVLQGGNPFGLATPGAPRTPGTETLFYPVQAVNFLEANGFSGNILPYATWGGYISWRLYPACKVAMDLRFETVYPKKVREQYFEFLRCGPGWREFLDAYPHDLILTYAGDRLHRAIESTGQWERVYQDEFTVILIQKAPAPHKKTNTWISAE